MRDAAPSVSAEARKALLERVGIAPDRLWELFIEGRHRHVRQNVLRLLERTSKWERLVYLLQASADRDAEIAAEARLGVGRWLDASNRGFVRPSADQLRRAEEALERYRVLLAPGVGQQLDFIFGIFRGR